MTDGPRVTIRDVYDLTNTAKAELKQEISALRSEIRQDYISRAEFEPIRKIVYGAVGLILTAVIGALIALVVQQ